MTDVLPDSALDGFSVLTQQWRSASAAAHVARDRGGDTVLVVVPHPELTRSSVLRRRFRAEAELAARAAGPWVAPVREAGEARLVTGFRPALALDTAVTRHGPLPAPALRVLGSALAESLARLHTLVSVHRGLAPHTVHLAADGPVLTGFGPLGAATRVDPVGPRLTLGFLTPEQVARQTPGPASDVFVLGLLLVYAATGGGPFATATANEIAEADAALDDVPREVRPLLDRCLSKDPAGRPTPGEIAAELAPDGAAALLAQGWLSGPVTAELAEQAATILASEPPAGPRTLVDAPPPVDDAPDESVPPRPLGRRHLLTGAAALVVGAGGGWALGHGTRGSGPAAARPAPRSSRVPGTAPTALWHYKAVETGALAVNWRDSRVILPLIGQLVGLDARTGKVRWSKDAGIDSDVAVIHDDLVLGGTYRGLVRLSAETGSIKDTDTKYTLVEKFLAQDGPRVWFMAAPGLVCYDAAERTEVWHTRLPKVYTSDMKAVLGRDTLYLQAYPKPDDAPKGKARFAALDRDTGKITWEKTVGGVGADAHAWISPEGVLHAEETKWARLSAWDMDSGKKLQTYKSDADIPLSKPRAMLWHGNALYVTSATSGDVYRFTSDGDLRWVSQAQGDLFSTVTYADLAMVDSGDLLLRLDQQSVVAIAPDTGRPLWVFQGVGEAELDNGLWRVSAGSRTAVFSREFGKHYFALPIG
ncbi:PQQ-binding-like beta-propeller repeat protein [Streptomyces sp. NPDC056453]|uniref:outer membrane protein assembly factor BamB family protein n=1 Tax=Streptomyces sp. NPDC056453 TaxID=3345822 RepID=UPI0036BE1C67